MFVPCPLTPMHNDTSAPSAKRGGKDKMSAAGRAAIAEAQRRGWAKINGSKPEKAEKKAKRKMSAAGRARIAAAAKSRWAKVKAVGKTRL